ncbi:ABC transporter permease [Hankyongella ginsenosidimutans]|uniref:ABC transporter permease n=1 Tax=Hankyongella ginsenosidimutans TaxID=1763828 RepID=UPI001FE959E2|nr:ABC transporter permease [Hankyongella ginsenosidimutans]
MIGLALAYLRDRPLTTALNLLLLAIAVAMLVLLVQVSEQASERFDRDAQGVDLVVGAKGSPLQLILSSIFHVDQPTGNIPLEARTVLERDPSVARVVPLALGTISAATGSLAPMRALQLCMISSSPKAAASRRRWRRCLAPRPRAQQELKSARSSSAATDSPRRRGRNRVTTMRRSPLSASWPTGGVADRLILTSVESVWQVHGIEGHHEDGDHHEADHDHGHDQHEAAGPESLEPELTALLVTYRNAAGAMRVPAMINRQSALQAAVPATETARLLDLLGASLEGLRIFAWLLAATGGLAILVALVGMVRSREGNLALLRVMGASRGRCSARCCSRACLPRLSEQYWAGLQHTA